MPAVSQKQQKLMGAALAAKKGAEPISKKVGDIAKSMSTKELEKYAGTKHKGLPKKVKKENEDRCMSEVYGVQKPYSGCDMTSLIVPIDPLQGLSQDQIVPDSIHGVYADREMAEKVAQQLYEEHMQYEQRLEEKKGGVVKKIESAINTLEKTRKEAMKRVMATPKQATHHKNKIATLTTQIEDLMSKLERVSKSQKELTDVESEEAKTKKDKK